MLWIEYEGSKYSCGFKTDTILLSFNLSKIKNSYFQLGMSTGRVQDGTIVLDSGLIIIRPSRLDSITRECRKTVSIPSHLVTDPNLITSPPPVMATATAEREGEAERGEKGWRRGERENSREEGGE